MPVQDITAAEAVQQCLDEIRSAKLAAGEATADKQRAIARVKQADAERQAAAEAKAKGEADADERFEGANERYYEALAEQDQAELQDEAALRVSRNATARLHQIRVAHFEELAADMEELVREVAAAANDLALPLGRYLAAYDKAVVAWRVLGNAAREHLLQVDSKAGRFRDINAVMDHAQPRECPLPPDSLTLIQSVMPRPRFMQPDYQEPSLPGGSSKKKYVLEMEIRA
jgi:hypothetical protein